MALNMATLKTRSLTAAVFVVVMLLGLLWNHWSFFILFTIVHFGCWSEYQKLIAKIDPEYATITPFHKYGVRIAGWCIMLFFTSDAYNIGSFSLHAAGWWLGLVCVFVLPIVELLFAGTINIKNIGYSALGLLYISLSWGLMMDLSAKSSLIAYEGIDAIYYYSALLPVSLIISIWINDTMAYIVGSLIGKTPFSAISPKKTWEGTIGGAILAVVVVGALAYWLKYPVHHWVIIAIIAAVVGTAGDLLESKLKRMANVKDSGSIMPGHGGFLDRFDSLLLATPFVWLYVVLFMI
ncbi:phosphatidate cytidylyltransferase [Pseudobacter ginsenosidimutans]|uniref:Phosphatidate cytidylyltransferase n=1 Tax=Pseudobacter ginsenosidimutans TaxID=661488 RepID=A0A4Q7MXY8_9BACT|nr:phosphatidate cytidylyltransferase [Pseudobacter ginsenosidimutans]QEC41156.1 phosphatidate cytidylyltransferase [Pseudobacter ginsenosidimutans]RZS72083.1 phosphatidate cytidylyltransferase [Pseudobacter ginsenosidimutans]